MWTASGHLRTFHSTPFHFLARLFKQVIHCHSDPSFTVIPIPYFSPPPSKRESPLAPISSSAREPPPPPFEISTPFTFQNVWPGNPSGADWISKLPITPLHSHRVFALTTGFGLSGRICVDWSDC
ncbi:hypothetical protein AVEN_202469-1 [Araneus ventricosus]|uniref:Uncharacterized protein n=1 Tax=Araneus ventricosus TaxID=182803 RepID=A0A4Y2UKT0_ARAVE|nr:hypothetical protein AVEN_174276-1 [Araneus ventricosus]GBO12177.1 hypothetical protein AVEN_202469-1 [Araneus ventricosus]